MLAFRRKRQRSIPPPRENARSKEAIVACSPLQWRFRKLGFALLLMLLSSAVAAGQLTANPTSLNFGSIQVGKSGTKSFQLTNTTKWNISITQATVSVAAFRLSGFAVPVTIAPGQSVNVSALFSPASVGAASGKAAFTYYAMKNYATPSKRMAVSLSGNGVTAGTLTPSPASQNFGTVQVGATQTQYQVITNSGEANVTISQATVAGAGFGIAGLTLPATLTPGQSVTFAASFSPTAAGNASGAIAIVSDAVNSPLTIGLSGNAVAQGQLAITPAMMNFGTVTIGESSSQSGMIGASGSSVSISSGTTSSSEFALTGISFPLTLAAGQSASYVVTFTPQVSGSASATLSFASNAANNPTASLTGLGEAAPVQHRVDLSWTSNGTGIVGYNIYRAGVSRGPYSAINGSLNAITTYTDYNVEAGQTYYYVVTAVDGNGVESGYSNEAEVLVPSP